jgi:protein O-GlcNAc transferase
VGAVVALARAHLKRKDVPAAGRVLEAAVARGLDDARIYAALADVYEAGGYVENAIPAMRNAIARDPKNELYHARYGMLLVDTKAPAAAIIRLREALREFPRSARLWLALGIAQLQMETAEDPTEALGNALKFEPQSVPALVYLGAAHADRGRYDEAVGFYERAIAADAKVAVPHYLLADVLLKQPAHDAARVERSLLRAVELDPELASAHVALGKFYFRAQRWDDATRHLERAARIQPDLAEAHYHLGRVYTRLRRKPEAQSALATFERLKAAQDRRVVHKDLIRRLADVRF